MKMQIAILPTLWPSHGQERLPCTLRNHRGHYHFHVQLRANCHLIACQIWSVPNEIVPNLPEFAVFALKCVAPTSSIYIQPMNIESMVVGAIQHEPVRRNPSQANFILHLRVGRQKIMRLAIAALPLKAANPRRYPRQMAHAPFQFFLLLRMMHWCGAHIPTNRHQLVHNTPHTLLVSHEIPQLTARHQIVANHSAPHPAHDVTLHSESLPASFGQEHRIDNAPQHPMPAQTVHELACVIPQ